MIEKKKWQSGVYITYWMNEYTENLHVTLQSIDQTLVINPRAFRRILGIEYAVECGCREITVQEAVELGFVIPSTFTIISQQDVI